MWDKSKVDRLIKTLVRFQVFRHAQSSRTSYPQPCNYHDHACRRLYLVLRTLAISLCWLHKPAYAKTPFRLCFRFSTVEILGVSNAAK